MSTGCNCDFVEVRPGEWWYVLENYNAPKNSWDWREYAEAYGPFASQEQADEHLTRNHANPGATSSRPYRPGHGPDAVMVKLMEAARERNKRMAAAHKRY